MQLVFAINVIITLLMLKPATSETCDYADISRKLTKYGMLHDPITMYGHVVGCLKTNTYFKELKAEGYKHGSCCKADDPSYANQLTHCLSVHQRSRRFDYSWSFCPTGYFLNRFFFIRKTIRMLRCCRPLHHPDSYGPCYYEEAALESGWSRCQLAGYYITGLQQTYLTANLSCCKMTKSAELCPRPWIYIEGFCYMISSQSLSWNASKTACKNMESTLAVVDSVQKQIRIAAKLKYQNNRIGLYRDSENRRLWIDSSRLCEDCGYWSSGRPDNYKANEGCGEMLYWYPHRWNDQSCSMKRRYICQKRAKESVNKPTTGTTSSRLQTSSPTRLQTSDGLRVKTVSARNESVAKSTAGTRSSHLQTSSPTRLQKVSILAISDANGNESTIGTASSYLQTSVPTRSQATQYVSTPSPSSNAVTDMDRHKPTLYTVLGLLGGLMIITIPITLVIKFWYRRKYKPPASVRPPPDIDENDFKYDVFVTYSRKDFSWVNRELLRLLRENQVKYCVDHKHFELGKAIVDNITDSVYQSRKVLAVWSGSYASSKYCKQELDYAIQRSFQNSDCSVIVITLDKTDRKQLPKPLRAKTFLDYSDSVERQGWEKRLIKHLKAPNYKKNSKTTIV